MGISYRSVITSAMLLLVTVLFGQAGAIETDRPDQTETPVTVPAGWIQIETGWSQVGTANDGIGERTTTLPTVLAKVGLCDRAELRLEMDRVDRGSLDSNLPSVSGFSPLEIGTKVDLWVDRGWRPRTSLIVNLGVSGSASPGLRPKDQYVTFRFTMQNALSDRFSLGYNLGTEWNGETPTATGIYTLSLGASASDRLGFFVEVYGFVSDVEPADHRLDAGATFKLGPDVQFDASGGHSLGEDRWFLSAGLSFRVPVFVRRPASGT